tara:strand:- start:531 stop:1070 length:540 start_codon:yes stop_codon:yes gene_type:complete
MNYKTIIETILLTADKPMREIDIINILDKKIDKNDIQIIIESLNQEYKKFDKGIYIDYISSGYQIRTKKKFNQYIQKANSQINKYSLSKASYEVLSIVCFKQPVSKNSIESIRGVDCSKIIKNLLKKKIIKICGKDTNRGKSILYCTTKLFLEVFGLKSLTDLPKLKDIKEIVSTNEIK